MKEFPIEKIRNICLAGQRGAGKTSLADAIAFNAGVNSRIGRVDDGSSAFDYSEPEIARRTSLSAKLMACPWKDIKINLFDCPGHPDFIGELLSVSQVCEAACFVIDATAGVQVGTQLQWKAVEREGLARFFFVNKMSKENVSWQANLESLRKAFGKQAVAVLLPIGEAEQFHGIIDLLHMKAYSFDATGKRTEIPIPAEMKAQVDAERASLIEVAAEADDDLIEKYFAEGTLSDPEIRKGILTGVEYGRLFPILFGTAQNNIGVSVLLEFILDYLPSPAEALPTHVTRTDTTEDITIATSASDKPTAYVFKTVSEGHLGDMSFFRTLSGTVRSGSELVNQQNNTVERISHTYTFQGKNRVDLASVTAGDIGVTVKLKSTHTGNTLCDKDLHLILPPAKYPNPVMDVAIRPKAKGDEEKVVSALHKLNEEDPSFRLVIDSIMHQQVLWAQGATHIEVIAEKLKQRYGVEVDLAKPKIPYRETIRGRIEKQYKHKKQSGGRGQYGDVHIRIEPNERGAGFEFVDAITGGVIPGKYIPAVEKGVQESMLHGGLAGAPVVDVKVTLFFGSYHDVDSSDMAFKIAGLMAFKEAFMESRPVLLEPIYEVEITVPDDYTGDVMGDLSSRRGKIHGMEPNGAGQKIKAAVPQAELHKYSVDLRSMTQGQGVYAMNFSHYDEVPHEIAAKVVEEARHEMAALQPHH